MIRFSKSRCLPWLRFSLLALAVGFCLSAHAKTTGVPVDATLQSGPCYEALTVRNLTDHIGAPDREIGAACQAENGDIDKAWARTLRLWGPSTVSPPDYGTFVSPDASNPGLFARVLAVATMILAYAIFGTPIRAAASLMGAGQVPMAVGGTIACLACRGSLALILFGCLSFPYATFIGSLLVLSLMWLNPNPVFIPPLSIGSAQPQVPPSGFSIFVADVINDAAGAALGILGLTLLARHDFVLLATALVMALAASIPAVVLARRRFRASPTASIIASALVAAATGAFALFDPPIAQITGAGTLATYLVPIILAALTIGVNSREFWVPRIGHYTNVHRP